MQLEFLASAKPFLKWAGGKGQLVDQLAARFPSGLKTGGITRYVEPFVGGGAVFFHVAQNYPVQEIHVFDINQELMLAYKTIRADVNGLIAQLLQLATHYSSLSLEEQQTFYYEVRSDFNAAQSSIDLARFQSNWIERTAQIIFLNRTCYNGLFRVNSKGEFNVPFGDYKNPQICDSHNLRAVSQVLQRTEIECGDFTACEYLVGRDTFVYFDPPYRPISKTASFASYSRYEFGEKEQKRLAQFYRRLDARAAKLMLSNSDPRNENPDDNFFEREYSGFHIDKVKATRMINCNVNRRGAISELVITNY